MIDKKILLEKLDSIPPQTKKMEGFNPSPEYRGGGTRMRLKRLFRYRGEYLGHIWRYLHEYIKSLSKNDVRVKTFWGRELLLPSRDSDTLAIRESGSLDMGEQGLMRFFIRNIQSNDIFYDIGANYGFYTALAQELISEGEVHSFEPGHRVFAYLQQLENQGTFLNKIAVSNVSGNMQFFDSYASNSSGKSTLSSRIAQDRRGYYTVATVQAITLDEYCRTHKTPTIIKIDVEGFEAEVLTGGMSVLELESPIVAVELWSGRELSSFSLKTVEILKKLDYVPFFIEHSGDLKETTYSYLEDWLKKQQLEANMMFKRRGTTR